MKKHLDSEAVFSTMSPRQAVRYMAVPAIISQLIVLVYNLADTFFLGRMNDPQMIAGVSLILPVFNITLALGALAGVGGGALIPKLLAVGRREEGRRVMRFALLLALGVAAAFSLLLAVFHAPILRMLGAGSGTFVFARQYLFTVVVLGGVPTILTNVLSNLLRSISFAREAGLGIALGGGLNLIFDPLLLYLFPAELAVVAVGAATMLSNIISCTYLLWVLLKKQTELRLEAALPMPERESIFRVLSVGLPGAIGPLLFDIDYMVLDRLMSSYGDIAMAGIGIVLKAERLPLQIGIGLYQGIVPLVAYCCASRERYARMKQIIFYACTLGIIVGAVSIALYELFAPYIIGFFLDDGATVELGAHFLRARAPATVFMFICFFIMHLYEAFGKGTSALFLSGLRWLGFNIPLLFLLNRVFGMFGLVWAQLAADTLASAVSCIMLAKTMHRMHPPEQGLVDTDTDTMI